jgi:hypothetical protein
VNYYKILNEREAMQWRAGITEAENMRTSVLQKYRVSMKDFWEFEEPLRLELWIQSLDNPNYADLGFCDMHPWIGDVRLSPPLSGMPSGYLLVVSERMKSTIEQSDLPEHKFYRTIIRKSDSGEERSYFIFHLLFQKFEELYYPAVSFSLKRRNEILKTFEKGMIKNYDEFIAIRDKEQYENGGVILSNDNTVFKQYFDVLWGDGGSVLVSENLKRNLQRIELKGVRFELYNGEIDFVDERYYY